MTQRRKSILEVLSSEGPLTRSEIGTRIEASSAEIKHQWTRLLELQLIEVESLNQKMKHGPASEILTITTTGQYALEHGHLPDELQAVQRILDEGATLLGHEPSALRGATRDRWSKPEHVDLVDVRDALIWCAREKRLDLEVVTQVFETGSRRSTNRALSNIQASIDTQDPKMLERLERLKALD